MKSIDIDKIYQIFDKDDREIYEKHEILEIYKDESVIFSSVIRSLQNFFTLEKSQQNKFKEEYNKIQDNIKFKFFCKYFHLLDSLPGPSLNNISPTVKDLGLIEVKNMLNIFLNYFITIEHYEKCSKINKFLIFINENCHIDR